ncbi:MAG: 16S rRNA (uracil(1498)-N(3))-methyltransferase [Oxalobacter formigenes]|nr:16S rRNA (uracil(1498)-N(3))-methyltransferase [Oxalobacter formigenes]
MARIYCPGPLAENTRLALPDTAARHIRVLRLKPNDPLTLFNGEGGQYQARITEITRQGIIVEILAWQPIENELPWRITLAQALPEAAKMDFIIEKAIELGVTQICPVASSRAVVRLTEARAAKRAERWKNIIIAASEQSGRNRLAALTDLISFQQLTENPGPAPLLMPSPRAHTPLASWAFAHPPQNITLLIGPEGGLSPEEETLAIRSGAQPLSLGNRILRTETAGIAAIAAINAIWSQTGRNTETG